jgi:hypothetical protein
MHCAGSHARFPYCVGDMAPTRDSRRRQPISQLLSQFTDTFVDFATALPVAGPQIWASLTRSRPSILQQVFWAIFPTRSCQTTSAKNEYLRFTSHPCSCITRRMSRPAVAHGHTTFGRVILSISSHLGRTFRGSFCMVPHSFTPKLQFRGLLH